MNQPHKKVWLPLLGVIPFVFGYLWMEMGELEMRDIIIGSGCVALAFVFLYLLNRKSDKG
jgi:hypothetical protein